MRRVRPRPMLVARGIVLAAAVAGGLSFVEFAHAAGTTYYVSATGRDSATGTTPQDAWRTIERVNATSLVPGDRVLLQGGSSFSGPLYVQPGESGTPDAPISFASYGTGRATINGKDGSAVVVYNAGGIALSNLSIAGGRSNSANGVSFFNDLPGNTKLAFVRISDIEVKRFGLNGIAIGGWNGSSGFDDVRVTRADLHDNGRGGLVTYGPPFDPSVSAYANHAVYVSYVNAYRNAGDPSDLTHNSGSGVVLGSVENGAIERSVAHDNGELCQAPECGAGLWAYDSRAITIQFNEAYHNGTGGTADGDGFDLDQNTSASVVQYNYSHDNGGAGYLLFTGSSNTSHHGNTIRYNVSQDDGRRNGYGAIMGGGQIYDEAIYNNTIYLSAAQSGKPIGILFLSVGGAVSVRNNIFYLKDPLQMVSAPAVETSSLIFQQNDYFSRSGPLQFTWGQNDYPTLEAWREATGQERHGSAPTGLTANPKLVNPGGGSAIKNPDRLETLGAYKLRGDTPLLGLGLDLRVLFGMDTGGRDYFGRPVPGGSGPEIGASEQD